MIEPARPRRWPVVLRWSVAAVAVAGLHGGLAWAALNWRASPAEAAAGAPQPAIMIELAAVSVAPEAPAEPLPPAPERVEPELPPPVPVKDTPPPEPPPPEPPLPEPLPPEPVPEPTPAMVPEPEIKIPELPPLPNAAAVLSPPPPKVVPPPKPVERKPPPKPRVVQKPPVERQRARQAAAPTPAPPRASAPQAASQGSESQTSVSPASWRGSLIAHLNRYKRFPGGAQPGTVQVAFAIDRSGRVLSARLSGSSGDAALDEEAVAMIRRASPVPAPPAGLGGSTIALSVPVRFSR